MNICVYCSSSNLIPTKYFKVASELGVWLAQNGHTLIYGGASVGLMEEVARAFKSASGAKLIGVIPTKIHDMGLTTKLADELIMVTDMKERKEVMRSMGEGFIALPGSFGTLDEIIEEVVLCQLAYYSKPIVFYDPTNFYEHLYKQFDRFFSEGFINDKYRELYTCVKSVEVLNKIFNHPNNLI